MQFGYYIAKKLSFKHPQSFTKTITRLAIAAVSISVCVVILAFGILLGFKKEIQEKVSGYTGDITITKYQLTKGNENNLFPVSPGLTDSLNRIAGIKNTFSYINKAGIIKSDSVLEGLIFKGVPYNYDFSFYNKHLKRGQIPSYSDSTDSYDILLSEHSASLLAVDTGDRVNLFFIENNDVKRRRPKIVGIFNTGLQEFDKQFAIADLRMLQRVVSTDYTQIGGYEVLVSSFEEVEQVQEAITKQIDYNLSAQTVIDLYPTMFQWLEIVDTNVVVIIVLMFVVAIINIITVLLILIIDRIPMIGLFKSMGANTPKIMSIFNWQGLFIVIGGIILGNIIGLGTAFLQIRYQLIGLPADTYYMDAVPFYLPAMHIVLINLGALVVCFLFTYLPVKLVSNVKPTQSINFQ